MSNSKSKEGPNKLNQESKQAKKDWWDRARIIGNFMTAGVIAIAAYVGSTIIPEAINRRSLESQKIIKLSDLVPKLYTVENDQVKASVIAMSSYGTPAVPFLLLILKDAIETENDTLTRAIISSIGYMETDATNRVKAELKSEISLLSEFRLLRNVDYIRNLISSLVEASFDENMEQILEECFSVVSRFEANKEKLKELNKVALKALSDNGFLINQLPLKGLSFTGQDLSRIDFTNADLQDTNLGGCIIIGSKFGAADLKSCNLRGATFYSRRDRREKVLNIFRNFLAARNWREAYLDPNVKALLIELSRARPDQNGLSELLDSMGVGN